MARYNEIGTSGLAEWSGYIREEFLNELRGTEGFKRYNEMRLNSPIVGAMLLAIEQAVRSVDWTFTSGEDDDVEDERIEWLNYCLDNMAHSWEDHVIEALTMLPFGYSIFEIVYRREEGNRIAWEKFGFRGQDTVLHWNYDEKGILEGFHQQTHTPARRVDIPIEKCILYRTRVEKNNPEGRSILRTAWVPYYYCKNIQQIEAIGIERDLNGLPMIMLPETAETDESDANSDYSKAEKLVRRVRNDEAGGVVIPFGWEFSLVTSGGQRNFDTNEVIKRYEQRILMSALAQFLMLGAENVGSYALSKDQSDFFNMAVNATADIISANFTQQAIPRLMRLNGWDPEGIQLEHSPAGDIDLEGLGMFFSQIGDKLSWTPEDEMWLRSAARLPEKDLETLEELFEEKEAQKQLMMQGLREAQMARGRPFGGRGGPAPREQGDEDGEREDNQATLFEGEAPDDPEREEWEERWRRKLRRHFRSQSRRILEALKETYE